MAVLFHQMPTTYKVNSPRHRYANVKSRIDQTDPNPAHKLSHSISELTIKEGRQINPRFANTRPRRSGIGSSFAEHKLREDEETSSGKTRIPGPTGIKSPYNKVKPRSELVSREKMPSMRKGLISGSAGLRRTDNHSVAAQNGAKDSTNILKEEEREDSRVIIGTEVEHGLLNSQAFAEESEMGIFKEEEEEEEKKPLEPNTGMGICGIEVSSNDTETTVVLKHILALGGRKTEAQESSAHSPVSSDLTIVEEDELEEEEYEEEYFESKDSYNIRPSSEIPSTYILPHLIPRLVVTDEDDALVQTVVDEARKLEGTAASVPNSQRQMEVHSAKIVPIMPKSFGVRLDAFEEEEEEEPPTTKL